MSAPFPCHPIPAVAAEMDADAALTARAQKLGIGLAIRLATPETAETMAARSPVARDVGVSETNPDGPHPGKFWLDIVMTDGRHLSAILLPELLAKLVRQAATEGVAP